MRPDDAQPTAVDRIVVTLDVSPGAAVGRASVAWLQDAYDSLVGHVIDLDSDTAELSGALGRTGDASLAGGMWTSPVTDDGWNALAASLVRQARGDASWWVGWLSDAESDEPWARADATLEQDGVGVALSAEVAGLRADLPRAAASSWWARTGSAPSTRPRWSGCSVWWSRCCRGVSRSGRGSTATNRCRGWSGGRRTTTPSDVRSLRPDRR